MADATSTLTLRVNTQDAKRELDALKEALVEFKTALTDLPKLSSSFKTLETEVGTLRREMGTVQTELEQWRNGTLRANQEAATSFKNLAASVATSAGSMKASLRSALEGLDDKHLGLQNLKKLMEEGSRAFQQGFDSKSAIKGFRNDILAASDDLKKLERVINTVKEAKFELAHTGPATTTATYGVGIEKLIEKLPELEARLAVGQAALKSFKEQMAAGTQTSSFQALQNKIDAISDSERSLTKRVATAESLLGHLKRLEAQFKAMGESSFSSKFGDALTTYIKNGAVTQVQSELANLRGIERQTEAVERLHQRQANMRRLDAAYTSPRGGDDLRVMQYRLGVQEKIEQAIASGMKLKELLASFGREAVLDRVGRDSTQRAWTTAFNDPQGASHYATAIEQFKQQRQATMEATRHLEQAMVKDEQWQLMSLEQRLKAATTAQALYQRAMAGQGQGLSQERIAARYGTESLRADIPALQQQIAAMERQKTLQQEINRAHTEALTIDRQLARWKEQAAEKDAVWAQKNLDQQIKAAQIAQTLAANRMNTGVGPSDERIAARYGNAALQADVAALKQQNDILQQQKTLQEEINRAHAEALRLDQQRTRWLQQAQVKDAAWGTLTPGSQLKQATTAQELMARIQSGQSSLSLEQVAGKFGTSAMVADLQQLAAAHANGTSKVKGHADANKLWVNAANEAHSAARGLAGGLNMLWVTWGSMVPLVAGAALTGTLRSMVEEGKKVEYQLAFLKGLSEGTEIVSVHQLDDAIKGSMVSAVDGANGLRALMQSGFSAQEALSTLPEILRLATVGETSVAEAAFAATGVMKAFGMSIDEIGTVSDVMAKAAAASNASVSDMMQAFKYASVAAARYGESLEETGAALAILSEKNIKGSMAGTAHMNMLRELYTPTAKAGEAFKKLGLDMQEMQRQGFSSIQMLEAIRAKTATLDSASLKSFVDAIGGERGGRELAPLLSGSTKALTEMQEKLEQSKGFTKRVMAELADTVEGGMARVKQAWGTSLADAFNEARGPLQTFLDTLANGLRSDTATGFFRRLAEGLVNLSYTLTDHIQAIGYLILAYAGLKTALTLTSLLEGMSQKWKLLTTATQANTAATAANAAAQAGAAAGGLARFATGLSLLSTGFGALLAIGGALWMFWDLFAQKTDKGRVALDSMNNRMTQTNQLLDQEIERLEKRNALYAAGKDPDKVNEAKDSVVKLQDDAKARLLAYQSAKPSSEMERVVENLTLQTSYKPKMEVTLPDGEKLVVTQKQLTEAINSLNKNISENKTKLERFDKADAKHEQNTGSQVLNTELDRLIERLYDRRGQTQDTKKIGNIDKAIALLTDYKKYTPENPLEARKLLKGLQGVGDTEGAIKNFQERTPHADAERAAQFHAEKQRILEDYRDQEKMAKTVYDSERKIIDELYQNKLITEAEYQQRRLDNEKSYVNEVGQAEKKALGEMNSLKSKADRESLLMELQNEKVKIQHRIAEQQFMDAINTQERTRLSLIKLQADNRKLTMVELPKLRGELQGKRDKAWNERDADLMTPQDAAGLKAREDVIEKYKQLMTTREAELAQVNQELEASRRNDEALQQTSASTGILTQKQELLKAAMAAITGEMNAQAAAADVSARDLTTYHQSFEYGTKRAFAQYRNNAMDSARVAEEFWNGSMSKMSDMLTNFFSTGKLGWKDFANSVLQEIDKIVAKMIVSELMGMGGGGSGGMSGWKVTDQGGVGGFESFITNGISAVGNFMSGNWAGAWQSASNMFGGGSSTNWQNQPMTQDVLDSGSLPANDLAGTEFIAKGAAYDNHIKAFAKGGEFSNRVYNTPTHFRYGSKRDQLGVMGEAGPEAIMPLARDRRGRLAVRLVSGRAGLNEMMPLTRDGSGRLAVQMPEASGGYTPRMFAAGGAFGGGEIFNSPVANQMPVNRDTPAGAQQNRQSGDQKANQRPIQITMNIQTPDAGSFRQSQGQVLAEMNRALSMGKRNM